MPSEDVINSLPVNTILTDIGRQKRALAIISGTTVKIEKFVVGDSNGDSYIPVGNEAALRNEKYRTHIGSMGLDKNDKSTLQISSVIPEDVGGFFISEYGLIDADGDLIAIGTCDPINKPNPSEGKIYSLAMVLIMTVLNAAAFEFLINYDGYVTYQYLLDEYQAQTHNIANGAITSEKLAANLALPDTTTARTQPVGQDSAAVTTMKALLQAINNLPDATSAKRGLIQLASLAEALDGIDASKAITANTLKSCLNKYQLALGFSPVQQGGGSGQGANKVYIGWSGSGLKAQVDSSDQGVFAFQGWVQNQGYATQSWVNQYTFGGWAQGLRDVTGSRQQGVTYTNSSGRAITVYVSANSVPYVELYLNGNLIYTKSTYGASETKQALAFVVQNGMTYRVTANNGIARWWEIS